MKATINKKIMYKHLKYFLTCILLFCSIAGCSNTNTEKEDISYDKSYTNNLFSIQNIHNWEVIKNKYGAEVVFRSPKENENDEFKENLNIFVEDLPENISMADFLKDADKQLSSVLVKYKSINNAKINILNKEGISHRYEFNQGEYDLEGLQIYIEKDKKMYVFTYTAKKGEFDKYHQKIMDIIETFEFK